MPFPTTAPAIPRWRASPVSSPIGLIEHKLDANPGNAELKGIVGRRFGPWTVAFNGNLDSKVEGPRGAPAELDPTPTSYALFEPGDRL